MLDALQQEIGDIYNIVENVAIVLGAMCIVPRIYRFIEILWNLSTLEKFDLQEKYGMMGHDQDDKKVCDSYVLVTNCTKGFGEAIALKLAQEGFNIALVGH